MDMILQKIKLFFLSETKSKNNYVVATARHRPQITPKKTKTKMYKDVTSVFPISACKVSPELILNTVASPESISLLEHATSTKNFCGI